MTRSRIATFAALTVASAVVLAGCTVPAAAPHASVSPAPPKPVSGEAHGAGSTAQRAAVDAWTSKLAEAQPDARVTFDARGSDAGRQAFREGGASFAASDTPFSTAEIAKGGFAGCAEGSDLVEIPASVSPIALVFSLQGVDALRLTPKTIAGIFSGGITRWDDPAIAATNPAAALPSRPILAVHRSDGSGTTANFTDYLTQTAPDVWTAGAVSTWPAALGGSPAEGSLGVATAVRGADGSIGYVDASTAKGLSAADIAVGKGWVGPSAAGASAAMDAARIEQGRAPGDLATTIDRGTVAEDAYPLLTVGYLIGCARYPKAETAALVKAFFALAVSADGQKVAAAVAGRAPISDVLRTKAQFAIDLIE